MKSLLLYFLLESPDSECWPQAAAGLLWLKAPSVLDAELQGVWTFFGVVLCNFVSKTLLGGLSCELWNNLL